MIRALVRYFFRTHDISGDGNASLLSERQRLARLLGEDPALPTPRPLAEPARGATSESARVLPLRGRGRGKA